MESSREAIVLRQTLVQYVRAMHELGWTMIALQPELALDRLEVERDRYRAALERIRENATSWHGHEMDTGHARALAVIGTWCDEALKEGDTS